jgi:hypothetical protein
MYRYLLVVLHSHRHRIEGEEISECDLNVVRDVMYKYSKKAMDKYLSVPELSFLFVNFAAHPQARHFVLAKIDCKGIDYC